MARDKTARARTQERTEDVTFAKLSSPRIFLVRMLVFLILCALVGSRFPVFGQTSKVGGGFRLMITARAQFIYPPRLGDVQDSTEKPVSFSFRFRRLHRV